MHLVGLPIYSMVCLTFVVTGCWYSPSFVVYTVLCGELLNRIGTHSGSIAFSYCPATVSITGGQHLKAGPSKHLSTI